jgi:Fur family ferric uptake transcriptional regulator
MGVLRKTKAVEVLLNEFHNSTIAISAIKLVQQLKFRFNKTTIYRVLDKLEEEGILHSFLGKEGFKWYAKCHNGCSASKHKDVHPHFQCIRCGRVDCLAITIKIPELPNRKVEVSDVLIHGTCEECCT